MKLPTSRGRVVRHSPSQANREAEAILRAMGPHTGVQGRKAIKGKNVLSGEERE